MILKTPKTLLNFFVKDWLLLFSSVGFLLTSLYLRKFPTFSTSEVEVLFILLILFIAVNGLRLSGVIERIANKIERGKAIPLKLILITYFFSMIVTNDVALVVIVPLTLSLSIERKGIIVILEAIAANAGSALTPFGNPQNLYIYWNFGVPISDFIRSIFPFSFASLIALIVALYFLNPGSKLEFKVENKPIGKFALIYGLLLLVVLLTVLHVLPVLSGVIVIVFALLFDRKALLIDYALLISFFFFFGFADNLGVMITSAITKNEHIFLFSALSSQIISNVPATLIFAKFTSNWEHLLWGSNVGGFGSLFGSFANLIAYKIYITNRYTDDVPTFTAQFLIIGYVFFFLSIGLYFVIFKIL